MRGQSRKPTRRRPTFGSTATRQGGVAFRDRDRAARTCAKTCIAESLILLTAPMRGEPVAVTSAMTAGMGDGEVSVGERLGAERRMRRRQSRKKMSTRRDCPRLRRRRPLVASRCARAAVASTRRVRVGRARPTPERDPPVAGVAPRRTTPDAWGNLSPLAFDARRFRRYPRGAAAGPRARWLVRERPLYAKRRHAPCPPKSGSHGRTCVVISRRDDVQRRGPWFVLTRDTGVPNHTSGSRRSWASQQRQSHFFDREVSSFGTSNRSSTNSLPKSEARRVGE